MRQLLSVTVFSLVMTTLRAIASSADDAPWDKPAITVGNAGETQGPSRVDVKFNLLVQVRGGDPPKPIGNAEVSVMGSDGTEVTDRKRTDSKGEVRFQDLPKGEITIIVIAKDWKTFKVSQVFNEPQETLTATLQQLD